MFSWGLTSGERAFQYGNGLIFKGVGLSATVWGTLVCFNEQ